MEIRNRELVMWLLHQNTKGNMLIALMISIGISGIMMTAMTTFFTNSMKAQKQITQKYEMLDLKQSLLSTMSKSEICKAQLIAINAKIIKNSRNFEPISMSSIKFSAEANSTAMAIVNELLPGTTTGLKVSDISLKIIDGDSITNIFNAQFVVTFDPSTTQGSFAPISVNQKVIRDSTTNKIIDCLSVGTTNSDRVQEAPESNSNGPYEKWANTTQECTSKHLGRDVLNSISFDEKGQISKVCSGLTNSQTCQVVNNQSPLPQLVWTSSTGTNQDGALMNTSCYTEVQSGSPCFVGLGVKSGGGIYFSNQGFQVETYFDQNGEPVIQGGNKKHSIFGPGLGQQPCHVR